MDESTLKERLETVDAALDWDGEGDDPAEDADWLSRSRIERETATGKTCRGPKIQDTEELAEKLYAQEQDALLRAVAGIIAGVRAAEATVADVAGGDTPTVLPPKPVEELTEAKEVVGSVRDTDRLLSLLFRVNDPETGQPYEVGGRDIRSALHEASRRGCGFDVNRLILAHEADGRTKRAECPGCGRTVTFEPPREA